jgi:hypothetical protein
MARPRPNDDTMSQEEFEDALETALVAVHRAENVFSDIESNVAQFLLEIGLSRQAFLRMVPYIADSLPDVPSTTEEDVYRVYQERKRLRGELQQQVREHAETKEAEMLAKRTEELVKQTEDLNTNTQ